MPIDASVFERGEERYSIEDEIVHLLQENSDTAYNVYEITTQVMEPGWSESNTDLSADYAEYVGCFLDLATVNSILDQLVDDGMVERRILDDGDGERSYYRAPVGR
ncbi:hypothetical protein [Natronoglomus mannanivorans]|uniref:Uncharacterized protein n=1 Tax=Natronoglomus mannanivorans TaxID=2979990 RepID=A0AAP2YZ34_9EURY|nr:hypothetical protein [Halobacteria archaeon AArc-xg1-1]